ncbi:MAG: sigma-70 family RNA polymerase sigma factor [Pyrinomonadaceae bacterium]|nr:sigma-70 family RNA polymerase sigma factor [Pyrinomonadaceae bacterium]
MDNSDKTLVQEFLRTKDKTSFRQLYRRHTPALYPLAIRLVGGVESDAQDAIQEMWIRACKSLDRFEWRSSLRTWLTGILINRLHEVNREQWRRHEEQYPDNGFGAVAVAHEQTDFGRTSLDLEQLIARLPAGYRQVLALHDIEGYTHDEIGALLEISAGTSKSQLFHARRALRATLQTETRLP